MGLKYLIVVDMQNDFINGALGTPEAQAIVDKVIAKVCDFDGTVIFTQDTHQKNYLHTQEGELLPIEHCIQDTPGWHLQSKLEKLCDTRSLSVIEKPTFGSVRLAQTLAHENENDPIKSIELIGLCTDICVVSNALMLKAFMPEVPILVDAQCCAGTTPQAHEAALATMTSCQIHVSN